MKKLITSFLIILSVAGYAQKLELSGKYLYTFQNEVNVWDGQVKFEDSDSWNVTATFNLAPALGVEFAWNHQNTLINYRQYDGDLEVFDNAVIDYYLLGVSRGVEVSDVVLPFGSFKLGAANLNSNDPGYDSVTKFAFGLTGGLKIFATERIGLRLEGNLLMPVQWGGLSIFCGTGGCGSGVSAGSTIAQISLGGGVVLMVP